MSVREKMSVPKIESMRSAVSVLGPPLRERTDVVTVCLRLRVWGGRESTQDNAVHGKR